MSLNTTLRLVVIGLVMLAFNSCSSVLLDERFHDERLVNWVVVDDSETVEGPSEWKVARGAGLQQLSNIWGRRGDFIGRWYGTFLIAGDGDWSDYTLQLKVKPVDDDGFGVVFRWMDAEHFYRLIFVQDGFNGGPITRLDKRDGADYTELWSAPKGYRSGIEAHIQVEVDGDMLAARIDGRELFRVRDSSYRRGKIGLFCYAQKGQAFENVRVNGH
jgi:hypothetical protein